MSNEANDVGLDLVVWLVVQELGDPSRTDTVVSLEVLFQYFDRLLSLRVGAERYKSGNNVVNSTTVVAQNVIQVVCVLVFATFPESQ